jgi:hypothetical protein
MCSQEPTATIVIYSNYQERAFPARVVAECVNQGAIQMHLTILASATFLALLVIPARVNRPVTDAERAELQDAVQAQTCSGGKMEWDEDDRQFEVDDAVWPDGRKYDLQFDVEFKLVRKKLD